MSEHHMEKDRAGDEGEARQHQSHAAVGAWLELQFPRQWHTKIYLSTQTFARDLHSLASRLDCITLSWEVHRLSVA